MTLENMYTFQIKVALIEKTRFAHSKYSPLLTLLFKLLEVQSGNQVQI